MLPVHVADAVKKQVLYYIGGTFEFRNAEAEKALDDFINDPERGLFKGPWIQIQRPFVQAENKDHELFDIAVPFHPFKHQIIAWRRLTTKEGNSPQHTIVTTGTGSGKTECFLYPVLDYALRAKQDGKEGIKAIILYPMNALASDQERRFAKEIAKNKALSDAGVRVGIFTGRDLGESETSSGYKEMGKDHGISNHKVLRESPPDILLTNYKMLDFLLMRPKDQPLWNKNAPGTLKYLILDELHTYDGAQGADVACLIRRLKEKLQVKQGDICVVGTSATIDDGPISDKDAPKGAADQAEAASDVLIRFAGTLFEEIIPHDAIIGEERIPSEKLVDFNPLPEDELIYPKVKYTDPRDGETSLEYAKRQAKVWGAPLDSEDHSSLIKELADDVALEIRQGPNGEQELSTILWEVALAGWLKKHPLFRTVLEVSEVAEKESHPLDFPTLAARATRHDLEVAAEFAGLEPEEREKMLASFFSLMSHAKEVRSGRPFPLLSLRVQLWMRELRRLGRRISEDFHFTWLEERDLTHKALPAFHCSLCGESGWAAMKNPDTETAINQRGVSGFELLSDVSKIYRASIGFRGQRDQRLVFFSRWKDEDDPPEKDSGQLPLQPDDYYFLHPESLVVRNGKGPCPLSDQKHSFRVKVNDRTKRKGTGTVGDQGCPHCGEREGIFFIGARGAVLSSVAIDEMYGSPLNADPKLLAFTDSVQDASHRAGFFSARTYQFTFRTALQHLVDSAGDDGVPLHEAGTRLIEYWKESERPGGGSLRAAIETLLPPDLLEYPNYLAFRESDAATPAPKFQEEIEKRLFWEAVSEFGLMQTHGRTMERMGSATLGWDEDLIAETCSNLRDRLEGVDPFFEEIGEQKLRIWVYGLLHRYRERGVLYHPFLERYAPSGWWGKSSRGFVPSEREIFPPASRYKPAMLVTLPRNQSAWINILAETVGNSQPPWHMRWSRRVFDFHGDEASLKNALEAFLKEGKESGLLILCASDAGREYYSIRPESARIYNESVTLRCDRTGKYIVRPLAEAEFWKGAPSLEYHGEFSTYKEAPFNARQDYYRSRYKKGALRRVVAHEHTGILANERREKLETDFIKGDHKDDPNVLTCTSTLEMGIDIGDLSSTMLCSIPPSTANYLQRIGRAGRQTGTSFIISVVNQRPHDLFFFARPAELLKGKIDTPGCWLDASAVLLRQYLGFCMDSATSHGILKDFPASANKLVEDNKKEDGAVRTFFQWMEGEQEKLRSAFVHRFAREVKPDTEQRFYREAEAFEIKNRLEKVLKEYEAEQTSVTKGINDLSNRLKENGITPEDKQEIERDLRFLRGRKTREQRRTSYEFLCENGLLPNYAFPDRGVRFFGSVYGSRDRKSDESVELYRGPGQALRELAPLNSFYTHNRKFEIQRISLGSAQDSLVEDYGVCGACGYMLQISGKNRPGKCPQCNTTGRRAPGGNLHKFLEFPRSFALSQMEFYESYSADKAEERDRRYYRHASSFDTVSSHVDTAVVGEDTLPFGIEYRSELTLREINTGFFESMTDEIFGPGQECSEEGFLLCKDCGTVVPPGARRADVNHARTCSGKKRAEKREKAGKDVDKAYNYEPIYLYREIKSEAIRLLVPYSNSEQLRTLQACIELGLRKKFNGSPAHLIIRPQTALDNETGVTKNYLVLLDGVPGGTGYLKALYDADDHGLKGEGILDVLRKALTALETCACRHLTGTGSDQDSDGCYRCVRSYSLQYRADEIKRSLGVELLKELIAAGEKRVLKKDLEAISVNALFESNLEKEFIDSVRTFAKKYEGNLTNVIVKGKRGYRLELPRSNQIWEIELQRTLSEKDGVSEMVRPDFIFWPEQSGVRPLAVFTDGKKFHAEPGDGNRLNDDFKKRRAIIQSGNFWVFSLTWNDIKDDAKKSFYAFNKKLDGKLGQVLASGGLAGKYIAELCGQNPFRQLCGFLLGPRADLFRTISSHIGFLHLLAEKSKGCVFRDEFETELWNWRTGTDFKSPAKQEDPDLFYAQKVAPSGDLLVFSDKDGMEQQTRAALRFVARLPDDDATLAGDAFLERWRRFLSLINLYQFQNDFYFWAASECDTGTAPDVDEFLRRDKAISAEWQEVLELSISRLRPHLEKLAFSDFGFQVPEVEHEHPTLDEVAELAWKDSKVVVLSGGQEEVAEDWEKAGFKVLRESEFISLVRDNEIELSKILGEG